MTDNYFTKTYNGFSGVDMVASIKGCEIGLLQCISYQISREMAPIYTIGSIDPRTFGRGKRAIAGSLVFSRLYFGNLIEAMDSNLGKDQFTLFDVVLTAVNEHGNTAKMEIKNCQMMKSGYGFNVSALKTEENYTYVAKSILPWTSTDISLPKEVLVKPKDGMIINPYTGRESWL